MAVGVHKNTPVGYSATAAASKPREIGCPYLSVFLYSCFYIPKYLVTFSSDHLVAIFYLPHPIHIYYYLHYIYIIQLSSIYHLNVISLQREEHIFYVCEFFFLTKRKLKKYNSSNITHMSLLSTIIKVIM